MSQIKVRRKRYSSAFKAKVGMEGLLGVKTVGQISREYQVHPVQVTQWKGVIRDRLQELFETNGRVESESNPELIQELHAKIGQLSMEVDWLKKKCRQLGL
jgi:transposase-like protein